MLNDIQKQQMMDSRRKKEQTLNQARDFNESRFVNLKPHKTSKHAFNTVLLKNDADRVFDQEELPPVRHPLRQETFEQSRLDTSKNHEEELENLDFQRLQTR